MAWIDLLGVDEVDGVACEMAESGAVHFGQIVNTWIGFDGATRAVPRSTERSTTHRSVMAYTAIPSIADLDTVDELASAWADAQRVELTKAVSAWKAFARFHQIMDSELNMPEPLHGTDSAE